jgi:hypothetical protein
VQADQWAQREQYDRACALRDALLLLLTKLLALEARLTTLRQGLPPPA